MPIRVDRAARRVLLAEAVWRLIDREGLPGASVRGVAREAQLSMGSVRHFFSTQEELLQFAMREVIVRATRRIESLADERRALLDKSEPLEAVARLLEQVLPLDRERRTEARIWSAFTVYASHHPAMAAIRREADEEVRTMCRTCLTELSQVGAIAKDLDLDVETERLWALLDGLTTHLLLNDDHTTATLAATVLRVHLASLS